MTEFKFGEWVKAMCGTKVVWGKITEVDANDPIKTYKVQNRRDGCYYWVLTNTVKKSVAGY